MEKLYMLFLIFARINSYRVITGAPYQISGDENKSVIVRLKEYAAEHYEFMISDIISERI